MNNQDLQELKNQAYALMEKAGFVLKGDIEVVLDQKLPYMGYTTERDGKPVIVVSGLTFSSGSTINLVVHEMSHVYRTQSGHPSHDYNLLTTLTAFVVHGRAPEAYQEQILHTIINHLQDLYADDISFVIFDKISPRPNLGDFFLGWIHEPLTGAASVEKLWGNADRLLSAAFAQANLKRHHVKDKGRKVETAVGEFLSKIDKRTAEKYEFFRDFMIDLPENPTRKEFEKLLIRYLSEFLKLATIS